MLTAQHDSIRQLRAILVASIVLPVALFGYASWLAYDTTEADTSRQIDQTREVLTEHALKVFESVERSIAEINEIIRDMTDDQIKQNESNLYQRLKRLADASEQIKSIWVFDKNGHALVNSLACPSPALDGSDRDYFNSHVDSDIGIYIGQVLRPRPPFGGAPFFGVSGRRSSSDGSFAGVIQLSVLPDYFEGFYARIGREAGSYASLVRDDGAVLARLPTLDLDTNFRPKGELARLMRLGQAEGGRTTVSSIDDIERKLVYRKLPRLPLYVYAGIETGAVRARWLAQSGNYLLFGIPATIGLIAIVALAMARTRKLYEEAGRRQVAEDALKQSQRLESLGRLTGGVAHDFNNLLMVVGGSTQLLRRRHSDPKDQRALDMIDSAVDKGASLTRQLLSFSRRHSMSAKLVDLGASVERFANVLRQSVRSDIEIRIEQPTRIIAVKIDPNEFEIALLNLTLNARDAMPNGGCITISLASRTLKDDGAHRLTGEFAVLTFSDTGSGIAEDIRERIFEPFFTTKTVDRGTGLGLSQIYGFVQQSEGEITVDSTVGRGTTFEIFLPRSNDTLPPIELEVADAPPLQVAKATTLLLVEDHPDVQAVAMDYAEQCGFNVLHADCAEAAVELLDKRRDIGLVFSDIVMPGMSGLELGRLIREKYPETPVVLASGYSDRTASALREGFPLLQKPYTLDAMRNCLLEAIRHSPANTS